MKQTVLGKLPRKYLKMLQRRSALCVIVAITMLLLHMLFLFLRTPQNHLLMLFANIVTDVLGGSFLVYYCCTCILPQRRIYRLAVRTAELVFGKIEQISEQPVQYMGISCKELTVSGRKLFLPTGTISLRKGDCGTFMTVSGIVVEVAYA